MVKEYDLDEQLKALADPVRMRVVKLLSLPMHSRSDEQGQGLCACDIESVMGVGQSTVSHHMKLLSRAGLVSSEKKGRWVYYRLQTQAFANLAQAIARLAGAEAGCAPVDADAPEAAEGCCAPGEQAAAEPAAAPPGKRLRVIGKKQA